MSTRPSSAANSASITTMECSRLLLIIAVSLCSFQILKFVTLKTDQDLLLHQGFEPPHADHQDPTAALLEQGREHAINHPSEPEHTTKQRLELSFPLVDLRQSTHASNVEYGQDGALRSQFPRTTEVSDDRSPVEAQQVDTLSEGVNLQSERLSTEIKANRREKIDSKLTGQPPPTLDEEQMTTQPEVATSLFVYSESNCSSQTEHIQVLGSEPALFKNDTIPKSVKLQGRGFAEVYKGARKETYLGIIIEQDGCFDIVAFSKYYGSFNHLYFDVHGESSSKSITNKPQIPSILQQQFSTAKDLSKPHTRIVFSTSSSHYLGFQVLASAFSFLESNQTNASWIRLLTARQPDDLSERFPTFTAPRSPESHSYAPLNKPDVIMKWFYSKDAPHPDDNIVVIDPDSWLLSDIGEWVAKVRPKRARGQVAYYKQLSRQCQQLWREFCWKNCHVPIDLVGVGTCGSNSIPHCLLYLNDAFVVGALFDQSLRLEGGSPLMETIYSFDSQETCLRS